MVQAELYEQQAEAFLQLRDFQSAMLNFRKVFTLVREQPCLALLALVLDLQELYCEALEAFTQAAELQGVSAEEKPGGGHEEP
ncbi:tetratricopeptide repeat protein 16 isoform X2 [Buteo buteo]|uniref:tetratricopeptide repeat protein 16 isoform X2 n=1 Tax=Buteo buteo TaxID=30397 RepID=UPI003EC0E64A